MYVIHGNAEVVYVILQYGRVVVMVNIGDVGVIVLLVGVGM